MVSTSLAATSSKNDQAQEYIQARKIALKDSGVQAAYARADEKLDDRIIEIDPTLKPYVEKRRAHASVSTTAPAQTAKPAPSPAAKQPPAEKNPAEGHVVKKGETLSSIALQYKVSVSSLKSANNITDERKLRVGQNLVIPMQKAGASETKSAPPKSAEAGAKSEPGFWDRLENSF
jgi:membrane-bound lytic murein transglycosylase D